MELVVEITPFEFYFATSKVLTACDAQNNMLFGAIVTCLVWDPVVGQCWMTRTRHFPAKAFVCGTGVCVSVCMFVCIYRLSESVCTSLDALKAHCCHWSAHIHYNIYVITIATVVPGCSLPPSLLSSCVPSFPPSFWISTMRYKAVANLSITPLRVAPVLQVRPVKTFSLCTLNPSFPGFNL